MLEGIEEGQVILNIISIIVLGFIYKNRHKLTTLKKYKVFISGFLAFFAGWIFTIVDELFLPEFFNFLEHGSYFIGSLILAVWFYVVFVREV